MTEYNTIKTMKINLNNVDGLTRKDESFALTQILSVRETIGVSGLRYPADLNVSIICTYQDRTRFLVICNADDFANIEKLFQDIIGTETGNG